MDFFSSTSNDMEEETDVGLPHSQSDPQTKNPSINQEEEKKGPSVKVCFRYKLTVYNSIDDITEEYDFFIDIKEEVKHTI